MGLLSDRTILDFESSLSTAVLSADTIKSAYLSRSLVDVSAEKSAARELIQIHSVSLAKFVLGVVNR